MSYKILIKDSARKEISNLDQKVRRLVEGRILLLRDDPRPFGAKPLRGKTFRGLYRIRSGDFRIIYQVSDEALTILVVKVGNRKEVYE